MKSTILLTTALFLASAPSPDSKTIAEFSAGFLAQSSDQGLMAAGPGSSFNQSLTKKTAESNPGYNDRAEKPAELALQPLTEKCAANGLNC